MHILKLTQIGNSVGVILPKDALSKLKLQKGESVFLTECADIRVALEATTVLKAIAATQWKGITLGTVGEVAAERWTVAGLDFLELSIRVPAATAAAQQRTFTDEILSRGLTLDSDGESKTVRVMRRLAGLDDGE